MEKPYAPACDRNKDAILEVLAPLVPNPANVLELGSGTGQHAVHFAAKLPHITWQTSDLPENHAGIRMWLEQAGSSNIKPPLALDVTTDNWPVADQIDLVFSANMVHIMPWENASSMFRGIGKLLASGGKCCLYGPFNYGGQFTSPSNASFNQWLLDRNPAFGIRHFEDMVALGEENGLELKTDQAMPANNRFLVWQRR